MVVTVIVGVLFSILLPAVGRVREAAKRTQCANNLAQIGIGLSAYHDAFGVLPAAYLTKIGGGGLMGPPDPTTRDAGPGWGCLMQILPTLDEGKLYNACNVLLPCWDAANATAAQIAVATYLCPSAFDRSRTFDVLGRGNKVLATFGSAHYVTNAGRFDAWSAGVDDLSKVGGIDGPFYRNSCIRMTDILDGTSQTVFVGERVPALADATWVGVVPGALVCPKRSPTGPAVRAVMAPCKGAGALVGAHSGPSPYETPSVIHPPNSGDNHADQMASGHPGFANVLFGDGSVRPTSLIAPEVWAALCSRNGGEMISEAP
jgi:prepilin-type processing-associated H-X9-DG protein